MRVKNPRVPIARQCGKLDIDLDKQNETNEPPNFGIGLNLQFDSSRLGWDVLGDLIKSKKHHR